MALNDLLEKQPIIGTMRAETFISDPERVEERYNRHFRSYVRLPRVQEKWNLLKKPLLERRTALGVLKGPLGYGKTGAAIDLWKTFEEQQFLVVPPFVCSSMADIMDATYGWVSHRLKGRQSGFSEELDSAYKEFSGKTLEDLVDEASRNGVDAGTIAGLLKRWTWQGEIAVEVSVTSLLKFLFLVSDLAVRAGFKGLIVIPDEFKLFIESSSDSDRNVRNFKDLIWGLFDQDKPLGFVVCMLDTTWAELEVKNREDIIHRLTNNQVKVLLEELYDTAFPGELWSQLAASLRLSDEEKRIIPEETQVALGQFCRRQALFNGPRSVVAAFKRAALRYAESQAVYDVFSFIDDYLAGVLAFDGRDAVTKKAYADLVSVDGLVSETDMKRVAKLLAAYPDGVPNRVAEANGLQHSLDRVVKATLGDHTVNPPTLRAYSSTTDHDFLMEALRSFRGTYNPASPSTIRAATRAFCNYVVRRILPQKLGTRIRGWAGHKTVGFEENPLIHESWEMNGGPNEQYPERRVYVRVSPLEEHFADLASDSHLSLGFFLQCDHEHLVPQVIRRGRTLVLRLNLARPVDRSQVPRDIRKLGDIFLPESISPLLLLACIDHLDRVIADAKNVKESDKQWTKQVMNEFMDRAISELFDDQLRAASSITASIAPGAQMVDATLAKLCEDLFPQYRTIAGYPQWQGALKGYLLALRAEGADKLTYAQRRGHAIIQGSKEDLATRFGYSSSESFRTAFNGVLKEFIEVVDWTAKEGKLRLKPHPLEGQIRQWLSKSTSQHQEMGRNVKCLAHSEVVRLATELGYGEDECDFLVQVLQARRYIGSAEVAKRKIVFELPRSLSPDDLENRLRALMTLGAPVFEAGLIDRKKAFLQFTPEQLMERLDAVRRKESGEPELDEELDTLRQQIEFAENDFTSNVERQLDYLILHQLKDIDALCRTTIRKAYPPAVIPEKAPISPTGFSPHLLELQASLMKQFKAIHDEAANVEQRVAAEIQRGLSAKEVRSTLVNIYRDVALAARALDSKVRTMQTQRQEVETRAEMLSKWLGNAQRLAALRFRLQIEGQGSGLAQQLMAEVNDLEQAVKEGFSVLDTRHQTLSDWELFASDIGDVERKWNSDVLERKNSFTLFKKQYIDVLEDTGFTNVTIDIPYEEEDPAAAVRRVIRHVFEFVQDKLRRARELVEHERVEHLKALRIYQLSEESHRTIDDLSKQRAVIEADLTRLSGELTEGIVEDFAQFKGWLDRLSPFTVPDGKISDLIQQTKEALVSVTRSKLTVEEREIMRLVSDKSGQITDVFVEALQRGDGRFKSVDDVLRVLLQLYRKGRLDLQGQVTGFGADAG